MFSFCSDNSLTEWEKVRRVAGGRLVVVGELVDKELAEWVELVYRRLRPVTSVMEHQSRFCHHFDPVVWEAIEAELCAAGASMYFTDYTATASFTNVDHIRRVFFSSRFVNLCVHNDPIFRRYFVNSSFSAVSVCPDCPFTVKYSYCRSSVTVEFSYVVTNSSEAQFY